MTGIGAGLMIGKEEDITRHIANHTFLIYLVPDPWLIRL
jgi:hypothetical protein